MTLSHDDFKAYLKNKRNYSFKSNFDLVYECFCEHGYHDMDCDFVRKNASSIVDALRKDCWEKYKKEENIFNIEVYDDLINRIPGIENLSGRQAIQQFVQTYSANIYDLSLSNTQSRRSRAGKEFEAIIELVLLFSDVMVDSQASLGNIYFDKKNLPKLVDFVSPSCVEYGIDKRQSIVITAKTTLRERWQEIPEEMQRLNAKEMFLVTLDTAVSAELLEKLKDYNIPLVTTRENKDNNYKKADTSIVYSFEDLISECVAQGKKWESHSYTSNQKKDLIHNLEKQIERHSGHPNVIKKIRKRLDFIQARF